MCVLQDWISGKKIDSAKEIDGLYYIICGETSVIGQINLAMSFSVS